ncbi:hypothetical protein Lfu02_67060 [Longispora fulva]|uniref:Uncharacterized protein n=1 Tax=Longispora fulva TaxID=619741 RepID=A0A8J7KLZ1_9ACTN|nr:hypothetical protein [Longispora fulva]MBG6138561.1 hypothetical protein [Longispora fulva]GIG62334.1 hypothetical protein Lfu02_67060 [Longispora fulva]
MNLTAREQADYESYLREVITPAQWVQYHSGLPGTGICFGCMEQGRGRIPAPCRFRRVAERQSRIAGSPGAGRRAAGTRAAGTMGA